MTSDSGQSFPFCNLLILEKVQDKLVQTEILQDKIVQTETSAFALHWQYEYGNQWGISLQDAQAIEASFLLLLQNIKIRRWLGFAGLQVVTKQCHVGL